MKAVSWRKKKNMISPNITKQHSAKENIFYPQITIISYKYLYYDGLVWTIYLGSKNDLTLMSDFVCELHHTNFFHMTWIFLRKIFPEDHLGVLGHFHHNDPWLRSAAANVWCGRKNQTYKFSGRISNLNKVPLVVPCFKIIKCF